MKLIVTMPARNEDWCLGLTARAVLMWADMLILRDHASTDRTPEICAEIEREYPTRVVLLRDDNPVWEEMRHRQEMLDVARSYNATHIITIDADEVLTGNLIPKMRGMIGDLPAWSIFQLPWICLPTLDTYYSTGMWGEQHITTAFVDRRELHWAAREGYDFHHRHPMGHRMAFWRPIRSFGDGGLMHLQFVSRRRLLAKQAAYQMTEVIRWPGRRPASVIAQEYSRTVKEAADSIPAAVPSTWWRPYHEAGLLPHLHLYGTPWQEAEIARLWAEDPTRFVGLDLFGVVR